MSIQRYRDNDPRTASEIADAIETELNAINSSLPVVVGTQNYAYVNSFAATLAGQQEQALNSLYDAAYITDATGEELTKRARGLGVIRQDPVPATGVAEFSSSSPVSQDRNIPSGTFISTGGDAPTTFATTEQTTINAAYTDTDSTTYSTTGTSYSTQTSFTVDADYRDSVDVSVDIRTTNNSYTAEVQIVDTTNSSTIATFSTTNTSFVSKGPTTYDISSITGDITIEFQLKISNSSGQAEIQNSAVNPSAQDAAEANIECTENGPVGNVGSGTITTLVDIPPGVNSVTNPNPTGDPDYNLTDDTTPQSPGQAKETDSSLRDRALDSTAIGGAGTAEGVELAMENIDGVISADVFTNRSNTTTNNVDPWHTEVRIYGGNTDDIADRLYEVAALGTIKTLQGGANGTLESSVVSTDLYGDLTIEITRPTETNLEIDIDVVHDATYDGTNATKDAIVGYIGGTDTDGSTVGGLGQNENVLVNEIENVVEDLQGVDYANVTLLDSDGDSNDDTTTDSDGVPIYSVGASEVALVDATDITVSETAR